MEEETRITEIERKELHELLDISLEKLNTPKNIKKVHWSKLSILQLQKMLMVESFELDLAVCNNYGIESECDDIINIALFIKHNLSKHGKTKWKKK